MRRSVLPVSIIVPTIGRLPLLERCLESLVACSPPASDIVVVDQSGSDEVRRLVESYSRRGARWLGCEGRGIGRGTNAGLRAAHHDIVLVTHDDCTVDPDWVEAAWKHLQRQPQAIVSGRVLPVGDPAMVPSTRVDTEPRDWTGTVIWGVLFAPCMAFNRHLVLGAGGFDERPTLATAGEDNDLCYRWLRAGGTLLFEPDMVVWHHDWRTPEQLVATYRNYARSHGAFYGKHLATGDLYIVKFLWWDAQSVVRSLRDAALRRRQRHTDPRRELLTGIPRGVLAGFREARRLARAEG